MTTTYKLVYLIIQALDSKFNSCATMAATIPGFCDGANRYSTVTDLARLRGWSTSVPFAMAA